MAEPTPPTTIVGGRKVEHLKDSIQALSIELADKQIEYLESMRPFYPGFSHHFIPADPNATRKSFPGAHKPTSL
ncbi:hypothetical protein F4780DRAFT_778173 [Xylariomycetidae sp. FL0641]|nr:hypothetical protein F4780DRAFT_778173 [Xylariomycetidae sp. FL0641]